MSRCMQVAGSVALFRWRHQVLTRAFGDDDHRVPPLQHAAVQIGQQPAFAFKFEWHLGNQREVHFLAGQGGARGDEAGVAAHQLHDADAVGHAVRFHVGAVDDFLGFLNRREVAEGTVHVLHIVVDCFRDADDRDRQLAPLNLVNDGVRAALGAVAAHGEQDADAALLEEVDNNVGTDGPARGAEQGSAQLMNVVDDLGVQPHRRRRKPRTRIRSSRSGCPSPRARRSDSEAAGRASG